MTVRAIALAGGASALLVAATPAPAAFNGVSVEPVANPFGLLVVDLWAEFDHPGQDHMQIVHGTPEVPAFIDVIGGTFFQAVLGTDRPPNPNTFIEFSNTRYDTFVTIGVASFNPFLPGAPEGAPTDDMLFLGGEWPGFGASRLDIGQQGWFIPFGAPQGDPFDPRYAGGGAGRVLLARLSTANGDGFEGRLRLQYVSDGSLGAEVVEFSYLVPGPAGWATGVLAAIACYRRRRRWNGRGRGDRAVLAGRPCRG